MRILLIEDDPLIGNGIQIGLTKLGFLVDWFTDGATGFNALAAADYDAVVLDFTTWARRKSARPRVGFNGARYVGRTD